jgi:hypothetical protein
VQDAQNAAMRRKLMQSQIAENMRGKDYIVVGKNLFSTKTGQFVPLPEGMTADELPKDVVSFNEFMKRTPEEQQKWLDFRRQNYSVNEIGGVPSVVYKGAPVQGGSPTSRPLSALDIELDAARRKKEVESAGKETGTTSGTAEAQLAGSEIDTAKVEKAVNDLKGHEGKQWAVGVPIISQLPDWATLGGTKHADFLAQYKKARGGVFLEGYKTLKGGGSITQIEGEKSQDAIAAMDRAQTKEAFDASLDEYLFWYKRGIEKLRKQKALTGKQALDNELKKEGTSFKDLETDLGNVIDRDKERRYQEYVRQREALERGGK